MNLALVSKLRCPGCESPTLASRAFEELDGGICRDGVLVCGHCRSWFPISDFLLDLLPEQHCDWESRRAFSRKHRGDLTALGLGEPKPTPGSPAPGFERQAEQQSFFDTLAQRGHRFSYERFGALVFWRAQDALTFDGWRPLVEPGSLVLDVGCGNGRTSFKLADLGPRILGFDVSYRLVRQAIDEAISRRILGRVGFFVADAHRFPVVDEAVDGVLLYGVLHHVPNPRRALHEGARVLRDGGCYLGNENNRTPFRRGFEWMMRLRPLWLEQAGAEPLIAAADMERWAQGSGLTLEMRTSVFIPPHICNRLPVNAARRLLRWSDRLLGNLPFVNQWGGLLVIQGRKRSLAQLGPKGPSQSPGG